MADRSVRRRKKKEETDEKPSETEEAIGKHLRFNLQTKTSKLSGHKVEYFTGSKAVDLLLDSKWASAGEKKTKIIFTDRNSVVRYLNELLYKGMFYRALKVVKKTKKDKEEDKKEKKAEKKKEQEKEKDKDKEKDKGKGKEKEKGKETEKDKGKEKEKVKGKEKEKDKGKEKEKDKKSEKDKDDKKSKEARRKIRLEPTDDQFFADGNDAYVWVYDPIKPMYYVYGALLVIGAIAVCLFPLWPHWMRIGTYYTSLGGAGLVGSVLVLAVLRVVIFAMTWTTTIGKIHFWLFPNLLADVGILESFQPVYVYDVMTPGKKCDKDDEDKDEDQDKDGDDSENSKTDTGGSPEELSPTDLDAAKHLKIKKEELGKDLPKDPSKDEDEEEDDRSDAEEDQEEGDEDEGEGSSKSGSSVENGQEGFEFIEQDEISATSEEPEETTS